MYFYKCLNCNDVVTKLGKKEAVLKCCDERMKKIEPGTVDASLEKHVPSVTQKGNTLHVMVGEEMHPMTEEHYIEWIVIETKNGFYTRYLEPGQSPEATFTVEDDIVHVYAYCNLHGLWKAKI